MKHDSTSFFSCSSELNPNRKLKPINILHWIKTKHNRFVNLVYKNIMLSLCFFSFLLVYK